MPRPERPKEELEQAYREKLLLNMGYFIGLDKIMRLIEDGWSTTDLLALLCAETRLIEAGHLPLVALEMTEEEWAEYKFSRS